MPPPARPLARHVVGWALLADAVPLYPLYALLFTANGLSVAQISALFAIWSAVAVLTEVPSGALADRFSRRSCLAAAGLLQAAGYVAWVVAPGFAGFAAGFVLWGFGGSLASGAKEALLYDGLDAVGAGGHYARVAGWVGAMELVGQFPAAIAATVLLPVGGFSLVGWVSVGTCVAAAGVAAALPEPPRGDADEDTGYFATLRAGIAEAARAPGVPAVVAAVAVLTAFDGIEEYFPLLVADWGIAAGAVPLATLPIVIGGTVGATLGGAAHRLPRWALGAVLGSGMVLLGGAGVVAHPAGVLAVTAFYGTYRAVLVVVDARLQERIASRSRATVTSVAGLGTEVVTFGVYAAWAAGGVLLVAAAGAVIAALLPRLLRGGPADLSGG